MKGNFALDAPYPPVRGTCSRLDMQTLMNLYSGRNSELTATAGYIYGHYIIDGIDDIISAATLSLAKVEMLHHALLGKAIAKLGGDPIIGGSTCFWSGSNVKYSKNPICFLQNCLNDELQAASDYRRAASCLNNASISELCLRIAKDEELHAGIVSELLDNINS